MMQGPPMISHPQSLPPLHHPQMHNLPPTTFMTSIPSAHAVAPLHQIHPQQVNLEITFIFIFVLGISKL